MGKYQEFTVTQEGKIDVAAITGGEIIKREGWRR
jgi:hypothetical protein